MSKKYPKKNIKSQNVSSHGVEKENHLGLIASKLQRWLPLFYAVAFALFAYYMLAVRNADYLFAVQERSLFLFDKSFFDMVVVKPGALMTYIGCFFTQFFYYPALGSCMLIAIWLATYFLIVKSFNMKGWWSCLALIPICALLASVIDMGYWIYYNKVHGYWFAPSVGLLVNMLAVWGCSLVAKKNRNAELICIFVWSIVGYLTTGWLGLLATAVMGTRGIVSKFRACLWPFCVEIVCIAVVPVVAYQFFDQMRIDDAWIVGLPLFQQDVQTSTPMLVPFVIMALSLLLMGFVQFPDPEKYKGKLWLWLALQVVCVVALATGVYKAEFNDYNYHAELRIYRAAEEYRWDDILTESSNCPTEPTREMILFRNLALTYKGTLGSQMFRYNYMSIHPVVNDSLKVHMAQTNAPLVYLLYGRMNFATRWSMENAVEYGYSPTVYKTMAIAAIISSEYDLAEKYLNTLKKTLYYADWADKYLPVIKNHSLREKMPELANMVEFYAHYKNRLDSDEGLVEMYLLNYFSNTMNKDSKLLQETTLAYALLSKDIQLFWPRFFLYAHLHRGEDMPIHYQEAAYLYGNLEHEVDVSTLPFDQVKVIQRYAAFQQLSGSLARQGMTSEQIGEQTKASYGDTFWWFYFFCRGQSSY